MIRESESEREFRKKLQNPLNPINSTETSPEMQQHIDDINSGRLVKEAAKKREEVEKKREEEANKVKLFCPHCRKPTLKRAPTGYSCGWCGLFTNTPLRMAPDNRPE